MKCAVPVYVSYLTITVALDDPRISDPSTYTELHEDVTCTGTRWMHEYHKIMYSKGTGRLEDLRHDNNNILPICLLVYFIEWYIILLYINSIYGAYLKHAVVLYLTHGLSGDVGYFASVADHEHLHRVRYLLSGQYGSVDYFPVLYKYNVHNDQISSILKS